MSPRRWRVGIGVRARAHTHLLTAAAAAGEHGVTRIKINASIATALESGERRAHTQARERMAQCSVHLNVEGGVDHQRAPCSPVVLRRVAWEAGRHGTVRQSSRRARHVRAVQGPGRGPARARTSQEQRLWLVYKQRGPTCAGPTRGLASAPTPRRHLVLAAFGGTVLRLTGNTRAARRCAARPWRCCCVASRSSVAPAIPASVPGFGTSARQVANRLSSRHAAVSSASPGTYPVHMHAAHKTHAVRHTLILRCPASRTQPSQT